MDKLRTEHLVKKYGKRTVVDDVSIELEQGEIVGLLGPNGAGKTTTFYMTTGLIVANNGRIFLNDQDITDFPMYKRAKMGIGYLPQEASVFRKLTVEDNLKAVSTVRLLLRRADGGPAGQRCRGACCRWRYRWGCLSSYALQYRSSRALWSLWGHRD